MEVEFIPIPHEQLLTCNIFSKDLTFLSTLHFPKWALNKGEDSSLILFCDTLKQAYGFSAYSVQEGMFSLIFTKAKSTPPHTHTHQEKSCLAWSYCLSWEFKCLATILCIFSHVIFGEIIVAVDTQIVLSLLLSDTIKTKNNRVKDIREIKSEIETIFAIRILFKYVPTDANHASIIT